MLSAKRENSPDNTAYNATEETCILPIQNNAQRFGTPKMPGEPKRVQPSRDTDKGIQATKTHAPAAEVEDHTDT